MDLPLDRPTGLALEPGAQLVVRGALSTSVDGSRFDALMQADGLSPGATRPGGLLDLPGGGLRLVEQHPAEHQYVLASTGAPGPACLAAGLESPCLVPRLGELAHERLRTAGELAATLSGRVELDATLAPPPPLVGPEALGRLVLVALALACCAGLLSLRFVLRRRAASALGRIRASAAQASRILSRDPTCEPLRVQVHAMAQRAQKLDATRRECRRRLARIDPAGLERRRRAAQAASTPAPELLVWLDAEQAEVATLRREVASCTVGLERIECALRVVVLRARRGRDPEARLDPDPVDLAEVELALRDEAEVEVQRALC